MKYVLDKIRDYIDRKDIGLTAPTLITIIGSFFLLACYFTCLEIKNNRDVSHTPPYQLDVPQNVTYQKWDSLFYYLDKNSDGKLDSLDFK